MSVPSRKEVLLVESDVELRAGLTAVLRFSKYKVIQVPNFREAIQCMNRDDALPIFGLILGFVTFRDSGAELLACAAKGNWQFEVILAMTSLGEKSVPQEFKNENVKLLKKPFEPKDLLKLLKVS